MRCFIAIPLTERVKTELVDLQEPFKNLRWQKKDQLHLTLKFLSETSDDKVRELKAELNKVEEPSFSITVDEFGCFPNRKNPQVLWAGGAENHALATLRDKVENICISTGFEADDRAFRPHITLARMKGASKREMDSFINDHKNFGIDIPVDEFVLYESKLHPKGAEYIRLKTFYLMDK